MTQHRAVRVRQQKGYCFHSVAAAKAALMYGHSDFDPGFFGPFGDSRVYVAAASATAGAGLPSTGAAAVPDRSSASHMLGLVQQKQFPLPPPSRRLLPRPPRRGRPSIVFDSSPPMSSPLLACPRRPVCVCVCVCVCVRVVMMVRCVEGRRWIYNVSYQKVAHSCMH